MFYVHKHGYVYGRDWIDYVLRSRDRRVNDSANDSLNRFANHPGELRKGLRRAQAETPLETCPEDPEGADCSSVEQTVSAQVPVPEREREIRISTGTRDDEETERLKAELEAKLVLGMETRPGKETTGGMEMEWDDFREQYRVLHLATVRDGTAIHAESRLDLAERILKPKKLGDLAESELAAAVTGKALAGAKVDAKSPAQPTRFADT